MLLPAVKLLPERIPATGAIRWHSKNWGRGIYSTACELTVTGDLFEALAVPANAEVNCPACRLLLKNWRHLRM